MIIAVDFDGTVVEHEYPTIGTDVPGAVEWLRRFQDAGAQVILWTMRCDSEHAGTVLSDAVAWFTDREIKLWGVNQNITQSGWSKSPKAYAHVYVDDAAFGCPLRENPKVGGRPFADWDVIGPALMELIANGDGVSRSPKIQKP